MRDVVTVGNTLEEVAKMFSPSRLEMNEESPEPEYLFLINMVCSLFIVFLIVSACTLVARDGQDKIDVYSLAAGDLQNNVAVCALIPQRKQAAAQPVVEEPAVCEVKDPGALPERSIPARRQGDPLFCRVEEAERPFHPIILEAASRYEVDPALVKAIILAESEYNPHAISKKGARGLMQLMPRTAQDLGVEDIFDPEHNINGGVKYFKRLLDRFDGDLKLALAAYNAGSGKVRKYQGVPPFKATRYYIDNVFRYYEYYKKEMKGGTDNA